MTAANQSAVHFAPLPPDGRARRKGNKWVEIADQLRARPGEWAIVDTFGNRNAASPTSRRIRLGLLSAFRPAGEWESTTRGADVYARYVGPAA